MLFMFYYTEYEECIVNSFNDLYRFIKQGRLNETGILINLFVSHEVRKTVRQFIVAPSLASH